MTVKATPRLLAILKERGITQKQLSEMTGIAQPYISRFDKNSLHSMSQVLAFAKALGLKPEELYEIEEIE